MPLSDLSEDDISLTSDEEESWPTRTFKDRMNPLEHYTDVEFRNRYRISKNVLCQIMQLLQHLAPMTLRNHAISAVEQVLLTISFLATGGFQITVADHVRVHKSTACRIIKKVSNEIAKLRPVFVRMPTTEVERARIRNGFYSISGFPNVGGAIDCTHVKIQSPGGTSAELFRNRKGYFSLNVQAVCNADLRILDVICRWPGSVHDTTIFNDSPIRAEFEIGMYGSDVLLGDSGYPCRKYLLTPFINPSRGSEESYNQAQIATRNPIERCFGVLKRRFPCLSMGLRVKLATTMNIIVSCVVLHNIALSHNDVLQDLPVIELPAETEVSVELQPNGENENFSVRSALLITHFNSP